MEHVVFYPSPEGGPAFRRVGSLEEAVRFVEHLRNVEGVAEFSVYGLSPVPLAMRPYYRVEPLVEAGEPAVAPAPEAAPADEPVQPEVDEVPAVSPEPEPLVTEPVALEPVTAEVTVEPVAAEALVPAPVAVAEVPSVEPVEPVVPAQPDEAEVLASASDAVLPAEEPSANGRRGLGFFSR